MEVVCSSEMSPHLTTTRCRNPKEDYYLISNHYENPKTYSVINSCSGYQKSHLFNSKQLWVQVTTEHVAYKTYCLQSHLAVRHSITLWSKVQQTVNSDIFLSYEVVKKFHIYPQPYFLPCPPPLFFVHIWSVYQDLYLVMPPLIFIYL